MKKMFHTIHGNFFLHFYFSPSVSLPPSLSGGEIVRNKNRFSYNPLLYLHCKYPGLFYTDVTGFSHCQFYRHSPVFLFFPLVMSEGESSEEEEAQNIKRKREKRRKPRRWKVFAWASRWMGARVDCVASGLSPRASVLLIGYLTRRIPGLYLV